MITIRLADARGYTHNAWLDSRHTFSFAEFQDPAHVKVSNLRVLNDDRVAPGRGFPIHGHSDMEIVSYVLSGALEHKDDMGTGSVIRPGDVQRMSAGTGVQHSESNASQDEEVHFLQIWLLPTCTGVEPGYAQKHFPTEDRRGRLALLISPDGRDGSISSHQDTLLYGTLLASGQAVEHALESGRRAYLHVARGAVSVNGEVLSAGDGARIEELEQIHIEGRDEAEVLLFDLP